MKHISVKVYSESGMVLTACAPEKVSAVYHREYKPGDRIALGISELNRHYVFQLEDTMPPAVVYVRSPYIIFPVPSPGDPATRAYSPKSFSGDCHIIRVRLALPEEINLRRNLCFNPYDNEFYGKGPMAGTDTGFYPHAASNISATSPIFAPRTAIDGVLENAAHDAWPYQAWSNNRDPAAELTVDFGRPVTIDELRLTLRADYPHDSWWKNAVVRFSDGSRETLALEMTARPQSFPLKPRRVTSLTLCELIKNDDPSPFTALTQLEAWGTDAPDL